MKKRHSAARLTETQIARVRDLRGRQFLYSDIARLVGCCRRTARSHSLDIDFTSVTDTEVMAKRVRRAQREQALIDACNRALALGRRPADALVMPACDGPAFQHSL